ncbi:type 4a pilus biogenesis protein PilO [Anthocerotibacter panamensis]|uniref:type 4a pilus biogenesis protein PilO n=1 Tax=Anthocerotibacter panamensis TaxID=2857077 RepID=UPI001C402672|nr:type 4a pilus biogenesis protein PilO [Anthocerotibacter panamensis]
MTTQVFGIELDRRSIAILIGVAGLAIVGVVAFNVTVPKIAEVQSLDEQITTVRQSLDSQTQLRNRLADVPTKLARAQQTFENLTDLLPKEESPSILLIDIARIVKGSKAELVQYTPGKPTPTTEVAGLSNLSKSTSKVSLTGTFAQSLNVLKDLERLEQLLKVEDLTVTPATGNDKAGLLTVGFSLSSYALPSGQAAPAPAPAASATPAK